MANVRFDIKITGIDANGIAQKRVTEWANDPNGPVFLMLDQLATRVQMSARRRVGFHTGRLHNSIRKQRHNGGSPSVAVVAGLNRYTPYLGYHMFGTPAHEIRAIPNRPNAHLRYVKGGMIYFRKRVWHPGTLANPFLMRALDELNL